MTVVSTSTHRLSNYKTPFTPHKNNTSSQVDTGCFCNAIGLGLGLCISSRVEWPCNRPGKLARQCEAIWKSCVFPLNYLMMFMYLSIACRFSHGQPINKDWSLKDSDFSPTFSKQVKCGATQYLMEAYTWSMSCSRNPTDHGMYEYLQLLCRNTHRFIYRSKI